MSRVEAWIVLGDDDSSKFHQRRQTRRQTRLCFLTSSQTVQTHSIQNVRGAGGCTLNIRIQTNVNCSTSSVATLLNVKHIAEFARSPPTCSTSLQHIQIICCNQSALSSHAGHTECVALCGGVQQCQDIDSTATLVKQSGYRFRFTIHFSR